MNQVSRFMQYPGRTLLREAKLSGTSEGEPGNPKFERG
jgi:hypothetical protein